MENLLQSIVALQGRLSDAGIPSIVIGGVAVATWGDPRVTRDVDLKVLLERDDTDRLLAVIGPDYASLLPDRSPVDKSARRAKMAIIIAIWRPL